MKDSNNISAELYKWMEKNKQFTHDDLYAMLATNYDIAEQKTAIKIIAELGDMHILIHDKDKYLRLSYIANNTK